jgi:TrmH family RNA methyltransferase
MTSNLENLRVVLVATRNPLNIGAAARAMSNFGVKALRVVNPYEPAFREARSAVGAAELLAEAEQYGEVGEAVADCKLVVGTTVAKWRDLQHELQPLETAGRTIKSQLKIGPTALLFGSERFGLSNEDMSHCHWMTRIPTREEHGSMNLGQAVAVCLYELVRGQKTDLPAMAPIRKDQVRKMDRMAESGEVERLTQVMLKVLRDSGYIKPRAVASEEKLRRLVRRMDLKANDADVLVGMMRQVAWKLKQDEKNRT